VTKRQVMASMGIDVATQRRIAALEAKAAIEQARRKRAEQTAAGRRSAVRRLQAMLAQRKAAELKVASRVFNAEPAP
jgi:hypothetical protein